MGVIAPPQTCVSTGPVAHWAAMSGPDLDAAAVWKVAMNVSVACSTTLMETSGCAFSYAFTAFASHLFAPGASDSAQNQNVRFTFAARAPPLAAGPPRATPAVVA